MVRKKVLRFIEDVWPIHPLNTNFILKVCNGYDYVEYTFSLTKGDFANTDYIISTITFFVFNVGRSEQHLVLM